MLYTFENKFPLIKLKEKLQAANDSPYLAILFSGNNVVIKILLLLTIFWGMGG